MLNADGAHYLRAYIETRRNGSKNSRIPPEDIHAEILTRQALTEPHRTVIDRAQLENQIHTLSITLKQQLLKELREDHHEKQV